MEPPTLAPTALIQAAVRICERVATGAEQPQVLTMVVGAVTVNVIPSERNPPIDAPPLGPPALRALLAVRGEPPPPDVFGDAAFATVRRVELTA